MVVGLVENGGLSETLTLPDYLVEVVSYTDKIVRNHVALFMKVV